MTTEEPPVYEFKPPTWRQTDQRLAGRILSFVDTLDERKRTSIRRTLLRHVKQIEALGEVLALYPSLFATQTLGGVVHRNVETLVEGLSSATPFTLELVLPQRAIIGKSMLMARLNFFRFLDYIARSFSEHSEFSKDELENIDHLVEDEISRLVLSEVCEEVLTAILCQHDVEEEVRLRAAQGLTHYWEDRIHFPMREIFPILQATWEARRDVLVCYGTLAGTAEVFDLMSQGCDPEFIDYFTAAETDEDAIMAFREFLFGLSTEEIRRLEERKQATGRGVVDLDDVMEELAPESLDIIRTDDTASSLYAFFMKRHLQATARQMGNIPGPKRTAEEYAMIAYLEEHKPIPF